MTTHTFNALVESGDLQFGDGYRTKRSELAEAGYQILRAADVGGKPLGTTAGFVGAQYGSAIGAKMVRTNDVVLTTKGTVGRVAMIGPLEEAMVYSPQVCYFRTANSGKLNRQFLRYWFSSPQFWNQCSHLMSNTDMAPYLSLRDIGSLSISLPPIAEQDAIAAILGALDDKIAVNTALSRTGDELASTLFAQTSAGSLETLPYEEFATVGGGGTPSTKRSEFWCGDIYWATPTDVTALGAPYLSSTTRRLTPEGLEQCASPLYPAGSILMTSRATIGAFAVAVSPMAVNQGFIVVNPKQPNLDMWLFHEMRSRVQDYLALANGATFLELSRGRFKSMLMKAHTPEAMVAFGDMVRPLHAAARHAMSENRTLAELRDTLLPALMSGRLHVKDAELQVEDAV